MTNRDHARNDGLTRFNELAHGNNLSNALALAEMHLNALQGEGGFDPSSDDVMKALRLVDELRPAVLVAEKKFSELSAVFSRLYAVRKRKDEELLKTLTAWLNNIQRMKADAALEH